jgi:hypothetical protein
VKKSKEKIAKTSQTGLPAVPSAGSPWRAKLSGQAGFVMILVIIMIALVGIVMFVLTEDSKTLTFQSDTVYLEAVERNLAASGLAWAKKNIKNETKELFNKTINLNTSDMNIRVANLSVVISTAEGEKVEAEISSSCSRGRRTFKHHDKYKISTSPENQPDIAPIQH